MKQRLRLWFGPPILLILIFMLAACGSSGPSQAEYNSLNEKVAGLEQQLAELEKDLEGMKSNVAAASVDVPEGEDTAALTPVVEVPTGKGDGVLITLAQYEKTEVGMTYKEVAEILGGDGEAVSEAEDMVIYSYQGAGDFGANAVFSFHKGKLLTKAQAGLE